MSNNNIKDSNGVNRSDGVRLSYGVNRSYGVNWSDGVNRSDGVRFSYGVNRSYGVNWSDGVNWSYGVNKSYGVNRSYGVNWSYGILNCKGVHKAMFLKDHTQKPTIFGIEVEESDFDYRRSELLTKLNGWFPKYNNAFTLYDQCGKEWEKVDARKIEETDESKAWEGMPQAAIDYIKSWPEFNADTFKEVTGIDVEKPSCVGKVVEIDGKKYRLEEYRGE